MWTRNYYNLLSAALLADDTLTSTTQPTEYTAPIMIRDAMGNWRAANGCATFTNYSGYLGAKIGTLTLGKGIAQLFTSNTDTINWSNNYRSFGLALGTGSTPVSYEDYKLDSMIASGLTLVSGNGSLTQSTVIDSSHHVKSTRSYTINNSSGSAITINEYGIFLPYSNDTASFGCLAFREVLDTPVVLGPSESFVISFSRDAELYNYTPYPA